MVHEIYERFDKLKESRGVTVYAVSKATGITATTFTNWKKGKYVPKRDKMQLIADYFNVSVDYLMTGKEIKHEIYNEESAHLVGKIRRNKELTDALLKYFELPEKKQKLVLELINTLSEE